MKPSLVVGPANNAKFPECGTAGEPTPVNEVSPVSVQGGKLPVSKPPLTTMQAGVDVGVGEGVPPCTKLTKTSCCDWPLMMLRPSVQPPMAVFPTALW